MHREATSQLLLLKDVDFLTEKLEQERRTADSLGSSSSSSAHSVLRVPAADSDSGCDSTSSPATAHIVSSDVGIVHAPEPESAATVLNSNSAAAAPTSDYFASIGSPGSSAAQSVAAAEHHSPTLARSASTASSSTISSVSTGDGPMRSTSAAQSSSIGALPSLASLKRASSTLTLTDVHQAAQRDDSPSTDTVASPESASSAAVDAENLPASSKLPTVIVNHGVDVASTEPQQRSPAGKQITRARSLLDLTPLPKTLQLQQPVELHDLPPTPVLLLARTMVKLNEQLFNDLVPHVTELSDALRDWTELQSKPMWFLLMEQSPLFWVRYAFVWRGNVRASNRPDVQLAAKLSALRILESTLMAAFGAGSRLLSEYRACAVRAVDQLQQSPEAASAPARGWSSAAVSINPSPSPSASRFSPVYSASSASLASTTSLAVAADSALLPSADPLSSSSLHMSASGIFSSNSPSSAHKLYPSASVTSDSVYHSGSAAPNLWSSQTGDVPLPRHSTATTTTTTGASTYLSATTTQSSTTMTQQLLTMIRRNINALNIMFTWLEHFEEVEARAAVSDNPGSIHALMLALEEPTASLMQAFRLALGESSSVSAASSGALRARASPQGSRHGASPNAQSTRYLQPPQQYQHQHQQQQQQHQHQQLHQQQHYQQQQHQQQRRSNADTLDENHSTTTTFTGDTTLSHVGLRTAAVSNLAQRWPAVRAHSILLPQPAAPPPQSALPPTATDRATVVSFADASALHADSDSESTPEQYHDAGSTAPSVIPDAGAERAAYARSTLALPASSPALLSGTHFIGKSWQQQCAALNEEIRVIVSQRFTPCRERAARLSKRFARPSALRTSWIRYSATAMAVGAGMYHAWLQRDNLHVWLRSAQHWIWLTWQRYVSEPVYELYRTIRYEGSEHVVTAESLAVDVDSLTRMVQDWARQSKMTEADTHQVLQEVRAGNLERIMHVYEKLAASPLSNSLFGPLLQLLLIQIQKQRIDMSRALMALDKLMKSQELNIEVLALIPSCLLVSFVASGIAGIVMSRKKLANVHASLREQLRRVERLLNLSRSAQMNFAETGRLLLSLYGLRRLTPGMSVRTFLSNALKTIIMSLIMMHISSQLSICGGPRRKIRLHHYLDSLMVSWPFKIESRMLLQL